MTNLSVNAQLVKCLYEHMMICKDDHISLRWIPLTSEELEVYHSFSFVRGQFSEWFKPQKSLRCLKALRTHRMTLPLSTHWEVLAIDCRGLRIGLNGIEELWWVHD